MPAANLTTSLVATVQVVSGSRLPARSSTRPVSVTVYDRPNPSVTSGTSVAIRPDGSRETIELTGPASKASWNEARSTPSTGSVNVTLIPAAVSTPPGGGSCVAIAGAIASGVGATLGLEVGAVDGVTVGFGLEEGVAHALIAPVSRKQAHTLLRRSTAALSGIRFRRAPRRANLVRDDRIVRV